jgi:hypothetical protein
MSRRNFDLDCLTTEMEIFCAPELAGWLSNLTIRRISPFYAAVAAC